MVRRREARLGTVDELAEALIASPQTHAVAFTGSVAAGRAVLGLGKALGMRVLAEGVETEEQFDILEFEGCNELQGYLFSRPVPVEKTAELIRLGTAVDAEELAAN